MKIIGIHDGHNSSVAFLEEGEITFAIQEERLTNIKNFSGFPEKSLLFLLEYKKLKPNDIDFIVFSSRYMSPPSTKDELISYFGHLGTPLTITLKKISKFGIFQKLREEKSQRRRTIILQRFGFPRRKIKFIDHHLCHAASAYYGLAKNWNKKYLILTLDGGGDWLCSTVNVGYQGKIKTVAKTPYGNSIGDIYSLSTFMMGLTPLEHEYKLMGLAPYVNQKYTKETSKIFKSYLNLDSYNPLIFKRKIFEDTNHIRKRLEKDFRRKRFDTIAAGLQCFTEELVMKWVKYCIKETGIKDILCSGGVFMNIKTNKVIAELPEVESISVFPSCSDESNALGGAWLTYYENTNKINNFHNLKDCYLGSSFDNQEIEKIIVDELKSKNNFSFRKENQINKTIVHLLVEGEIVARCSGKMEFGARALGNRSILADPSNQNVVNIINKMIKKRDFWMPFAPVVLKEKAGIYIKNPKNLSSPYMMMGFDTTDKRNDFIAAIHIADNTARPQILEKGQNLDLEEILEEFEKLTGRSILLNTSFNLHGHPIVFGPREAIWTLNNSGLKYLVIDNFLLSKKS